MKNIGLYLIIGGVAIFILVMLGNVFSLIVEHPILGLATIAIIIGIALILLNMVQENQKAKKDEKFRGIEK